MVFLVLFSNSYGGECISIANVILSATLYFKLALPFRAGLFPHFWGWFSAFFMHGPPKFLTYIFAHICPSSQVFFSSRIAGGIFSDRRWAFLGHFIVLFTNVSLLFAPPPTVSVEMNFNLMFIFCFALFRTTSRRQWARHASTPVCPSNFFTSRAVTQNAFFWHVYAARCMVAVKSFLRCFGRVRLATTVCFPFGYCGPLVRMWSSFPWNGPIW